MVRDLKGSTTLKIISYILGPVLAMILIASIIGVAYVERYPDTMQEENFTDTERFAKIYENIIDNLCSTAQIEGYYFTDDINYYVETSSGKQYTNMGVAQDKELAKQRVQTHEIRWIQEDNKIETTISKLERDMAWMTSQDITVYTYLDENNLTRGDFAIGNMLHNIARGTYNWAILLIPMSIIGLILIAIYLVISVGHKNKIDGIYLNSFDKIPLEIAAFIIIMLYTVSFGMFIIAVNTFNTLTTQIICTGIGLIPIYLVTILTFITIFRRIKAHTFLRNTFLYKVLKGLQEYLQNMRITLRLGFVYAGFTLLTLILILSSDSGVAVLLLLILWGTSGVYLLNRGVAFQKIKDFIQNLYEGKKQDNLKIEEFKGDQKEIALQLNDIASGLTNAIEEGIKSEKMKTELITNVSHDIKTPLTSIMNYIDLMKKEEIENEKIKEYLEVLQKKADRLKKLTEDLVEASKASSGNIKLNKQTIYIKELITQEIGEFDEKFQARGLKLITDFPEEEITTVADGKYLARVLDNVFSNVAKYAMQDSRVYVDVKIKDDKKEISIKNISSEKLNISAQQLMERFVRGDVARTTEGSGLRIIHCKKFNRITRRQIRYLFRRRPF